MNKIKQSIYPFALKKTKFICLHSIFHVKFLKNNVINIKIILPYLSSISIITNGNECKYVLKGIVRKGTTRNKNEVNEQNRPCNIEYCYFKILNDQQRFITEIKFIPQ